MEFEEKGFNIQADISEFDDGTTPLLRRRWFWDTWKGRGREEAHGERPSGRLINSNTGAINLSKKKVLQLRTAGVWMGDPFHSLINSPWSRLILVISLSYLFTWILFGIAYFLCPGNCLSFSDEHTARMAQAILFSVVTQATIGFGNTYPSSLYAGAMVILQALIGIMMDSCCIGLIYAKFSRPTKRATSIKFSKNALVAKRDGKESFMFRITNIRKHQIIEPHLRAYLCLPATTREGEKYMKFTKLDFDQSGMIFLSGFPYTMVHVIDSESPLQLEPAWLDGEIIIIFEGIDSTTGNSIQTRCSYIKEDIIFNMRFANVLRTDYDGRLTVDFSRFHQLRKIDNVPSED